MFSGGWGRVVVENLVTCSPKLAQLTVITINQVTVPDPSITGIHALCKKIYLLN
jgi:hypothetical protein